MAGRGAGGGPGVNEKKLRMMKMFQNQLVVILAQLCEYTKNLCIVYIYFFQLYTSEGEHDEIWIISQS